VAWPAAWSESAGAGTEHRKPRRRRETAINTAKTHLYRLPLLLAAVLAAAGLVPAVASAASTPHAAGRSAIFGGGPFYEDGQAVINTLRSSGYTTVVLWTIHVHAGSGDLYYNDHLVVSNGKYVGDAGWPARLHALRQAPTSVNRIEVGVGSAGPDDWGVVDALIKAHGTGSGSILYRNFQALRTATGADAINNDDEQHYDLASTTAFAKMAAAQGYRFTFAPYTNTTFWAKLKANLGGTVDRVYLQDYAGGAGNDPKAWNKALGITVDPGLWSRHGTGCSAGDTPSRVKAQMGAWHQSAGITGGFMWLYDDMKKCSAQGTAAAYAAAINSAVGSGIRR
jgi:hypothetical protein